jgi:hypothetical protein
LTGTGSTLTGPFTVATQNGAEYSEGAFQPIRRRFVAVT